MRSARQRSLDAHRAPPVHYRPLPLGLALAGLLLCTCASSPQGESAEPPLALDAKAAEAPATVTGTAPAVLRDMSGHLARVAEDVLPAVVNIAAERVSRSRFHIGPFFDDPFFERFFGGPDRRHPDVPQERREQSRGSGVIVAADGVVLTNHHVIDEADEIRVTLSDGREFGAEVIGTDERSDLAALRLKGDDDQRVDGLDTLPFGDSDALRPGEFVMAVGNPFGLTGTVTLGIVSATGRANVGIVDYEDFIQTDAAINPGNSGGALVDLSGQLVGINSAILSRTGGHQGIGFAIPSAMASNILDQLLDKGRVARGWLGVSIQSVTPELAEALGADLARGALVADVLEDSPAEEAGLRAGDIVTHIGDEALSSSAELRNRVGLTSPGSVVTLTVVRDGEELKLAVTLTERSDEETDRDEPASEDESEPAGFSVAPLDRSARESFDIPDSVKAGVVVTEVQLGSRAARAGLRPGDVIVEVGRRAVDDEATFARAFRKAEKPVLVRVHRGSGSLFLLLD